MTNIWSMRRRDISRVLLVRTVFLVNTGHSYRERPKWSTQQGNNAVLIQHRCKMAVYMLQRQVQNKFVVSSRMIAVRLWCITLYPWFYSVVCCCEILSSTQTQLSLTRWQPVGVYARMKSDIQPMRRAVFIAWLGSSCSPTRIAALCTEWWYSNTFVNGFPRSLLVPAESTTTTLHAHAGILRINIWNAFEGPMEIICCPPADDTALRSRNRLRELAYCFSTDLP